ncbi:MAG: 50S ribosomal protein L22 [Candidatus Nanohaloarchaeota archaeon]|nr:50S ribosomal protein L22 [Candidatus Nanohaloarchaeota archaeon]
MAGHPFVKQYEPEKHVLAITTYRRISPKDARELLVHLRGRKALDALKLLDLVIKKKYAVPFKRYTEGAAHKTGNIAGGRYPVNAAKEIKNLINSLIKNAEYKGFDADAVYIKYVAVSRAATFHRPRRSRFRGQKAKSTHLYVLGEVREK